MLYDSHNKMFLFTKFPYSKKESIAPTYILFYCLSTTLPFTVEWSQKNLVKSFSSTSQLFENIYHCVRVVIEMCPTNSVKVRPLSLTGKALVI